MGQGGQISIKGKQYPIKLAARFWKQYGAEIVTDYIANQFAARIGSREYDITGDVTDAGTWEPWAECNDALLRQRIIDCCIMF